MSFPPHDSDSAITQERLSGEEARLLTRREEVVAAGRDARLALRPRFGGSSARGLKRTGSILMRLLIGFCLLLVVAIFAMALWLRHSMHAALPQLDGPLQVAGLSHAVTVTRDAHGVPSIQAASLDDLFFAQGYVTAQDRLWQMDALRRHAAGELAEILGSGLVMHDRTQRTLRLRAAAERALAVLPADQRHQLDAYAAGVNAFLAQNGDHLPVEFHLLHYTPAAWSARDSFLIALAMFQDLGTDYPSKLQREALSAHLPVELLPDLYPVGAWRDHPPGQVAPDLTSPRPEIEQIPLDETQSHLDAPAIAPADLLAARAASFQPSCENCRSGSNNWAVAGTRSASGMPLVSNDMHLALGIPSTWYEAGLHTADGGLDVTGLTLPGTPFVIVGRNAHVAWGFTNLGGDVQDVYVEHTRKSGAEMEFERADGTWAIVAHHPEHIHVRGSRDVTLDVMSTTHSVGTEQMETPIISGLYPSEKRVLSLAWTAYSPSSLSEPFLAVNTAADGASLAAAFSRWGGPTLSLIYADDHNHIGFQAVGRIPVRGPAVRHEVAPSVLSPEGLPPPDEDDTSASASSGGHRVLAAYRPATKRPRRKTLPKVPAAPAEAPIPVPPPAVGYTIGSPIPPVPVDALDANAQWSGYIPFAELPAVVDPPGGVLATANARVTQDDYPYAVALNWAAPYRVERITRLLANRSSLKPADMLAVQMDIHSEFDLVLAQRFAYALDHAPDSGHDAKRLHQAADILRHWNGEVDADAAAPTILAAARAELWQTLLVAQITAHDQAAGLTRNDVKPEAIAKLYTWGEQSYALEQFVLHQPPRWLPQGVADWNTLLAGVVDRALTNAHAPADLVKWGYAKTHPVEINHPVLSMSPVLGRLLGVAVSSGPRFIGGDTTAIKATSRSNGPSERFTADLADPQATISNLPAGQSGNPASPWYLDQLPLWLGGATLPLPLDNAPAQHTLTLHP